MTPRQPVSVRESSWNFLTRRQALQRGAAAGISLATAGALGTACGGGRSSAGGLPVVKIHALQGGTGAAAMRIIKDRGFDTKNGFKGAYFQVDDAASRQFLLQGRSDVSFDGDLIGTAVLSNQGYKIATFYPIALQDASMVTRSDAPYRSPTDLKGKKVGHDGLESGTVTAAQVMLKQFEGVDILKDYKLQLAPTAALARLVAKGSIEAAFLDQPAILAAQRSLGLKVIWGPAWKIWESKRGGRSWNITMMAHQSWIKANPKLARGVTRAWDDAYRWMRQDPTRITKPPYPDLLEVTDKKVIDPFATLIGQGGYFTNRWTGQDVKAAKDFLAFSAQDGTVIKKVPPGAVIRL